MDALRRPAIPAARASAVVAHGVPVGLGEPLFDKLDADIAYAMMGINAVKGVEIGAGFAVVGAERLEHGDELTPQGFASNHAGGVLGGISTGQDLVVSIAVKPTSSSSRRATASTAGPGRRRWRPTAATTPASASAPRRSPRRCWRWW